MERSQLKTLPRLYPIIDAAALSCAGIPIGAFAQTLRNAGIRFLQYRDKEGSDEELIQQTLILRTIFPPADSTLILNDRVHLLDATGFDGLHIGQDDISAQAARESIGVSRMLGVSTHSPAQLTAAASMPVDYVAVGPVFATQSKDNPDSIVGLAGVRAARTSTDKPIVAIGGITIDNARSVFEAGADSIALISALLSGYGESPGKVIADFLARIA